MCEICGSTEQTGSGGRFGFLRGIVIACSPVTTGIRRIGETRPGTIPVEFRMSLLHPAILYGLGLAAIPVILHLLLRQKPKKLLFPALRLIQNRRKQNVRRMRIRHLLLLLLRVLIISALVFAIARPSVPAADYSLNLRETLTLIGVIIAAVAVYYGLSYRWRKTDLPAYEQKVRRSKLRSGAVGAAVLILLLAVVWPYQRRISAELKSPAPAGDATLPVAGVFLFDTSLSMGYQQAGKTRLDVAREIALSHLSDLPVGSRVAVADVGSDHPLLFQSTLAGAKMQLESRELRPVRLPLNDRIQAALRLHEDDRERTLSEQGAIPTDQRKDRYLRRIYVFTDLAKSAWRIGGTSRLTAELERLQNVNLFLIDVGETDPPNVAILDAEPVRPRVTIGGEAVIRAQLRSARRTEGEQTVELLLSDSTGRPIKVDRLRIELAENTPRWVEFSPQVIQNGPIIHGQVQLVSSDPLAFDDVRHFTIAAGPPIRVLTIAPQESEALAWNAALSAEGYEPVTRRPEELPSVDLADFDVICLINVPSLSNAQWYELGQFVANGGGLGVFLGSTDPEYQINYTRDEPQVFLPGKPIVHTAPGVQYLRTSNMQHPMMQALANDDFLSLLETADVYRFWRVAPVEDATVVAEYTDNDRSPALLERRHGEGRVLMLTTAVDIKQPWWARWNVLPNPDGPVWTFIALADEMVRHLAQHSDVQLNYVAGEQPVLRLGEASKDRQFLLQQPGFQQSRLKLSAGESLLTIPEVNDLGAYNLKQADDAASIVSGFSVNPPPGESDFTRVSNEELDQMLGEGRYQVARSIGELQEEINIADLGRELFPLILAAAVLIFVGEHFLANWFYDDEPGTAPSRVTWEPRSSETRPSPLATSGELMS